MTEDTQKILEVIEIFQKSVDTRLDRVETRLDRVESRLEGLETEHRQMMQAIKELDKSEFEIRRKVR